MCGGEEKTCPSVNGTELVYSGEINLSILKETRIATKSNANEFNTMRKVKVGIYCYLTAGILTERFYKCLMSSPPASIKKLYKFHILICCHGN